MSSSIVITREEFIKLIKFGEIEVCKNSVLSDESPVLELLSILASKSFDDELGFLVLNIKSDISFSSAYCIFNLKIDDIEEIFCLTPKALNFYQSKFDSRIYFQLLHDIDNILPQIESNQTVNDKKKGIKVLFEVFGIKESVESIQFFEQGVMKEDELIQGLLSYQQVGYLDQKFISSVNDLFCYDRKGNFFSNDFSYLLDLRTLSTLKARAPEQINLFYSQNLNVLRNGESLQNTAPLNELLNEALQNVENNPNSNEDKKRDLKEFLLVGSIFLKSKTLLEPDDKKPNCWEAFISHIHSFIKEYRQETIKALYLLGVYLGYKYLYDDYYGWKPLAIFKRQPSNAHEDFLVSNNPPLPSPKEYNPSQVNLVTKTNESAVDFVKPSAVEEKQNSGSEESFAIKEAVSPSQSGSLKMTTAKNADKEVKKQNNNVIPDAIGSEKNFQHKGQVDLFNEQNKPPTSETAPNSSMTPQELYEHYEGEENHNLKYLKGIVDSINQIEGSKRFKKSQAKDLLTQNIEKWFLEKGVQNESN